MNKKITIFLKLHENRTIHVNLLDVKKFLFRLLDGEKIEAVLMEHNYGLSVCVSSQVGCNMGCRFCESGRLKKVRNLDTYEIVEQILLIENYINKKINR